MTIKVYDLGPGTLKLGTSGSSLNIEAQLRNCRVESAEQVTSTDPKPVLSGEELTGNDKVTFTWTLAGTLFQDLSAAGIIDWSWANRATWTPFEFVPSTSAGRVVKGSVSPVPIMVGGEVTGTAEKRGDNPTSDFSWRAKGPVVTGGKPTTPDPILGTVTP